MNWLTAIFGLLGLYGLAGLLYTYVQWGSAAGQDGMLFWAGLIILCVLAAGVNEWRARRRRPALPPTRPEEHS
jgi:hypothetical protein